MSDPHLRFWLSFVERSLPDIERGRGDLALRRIKTSWTTWVGTAVEPVVREALRRLPELTPAGPAVVGGYWTRSNNPEIDLVGADREPVARQLTFLGSIKWRENRGFEFKDLTELVGHRTQLPGADADTPLLAVTRSGEGVGELRVLGPGDLMAAWEPGGSA